MIAQYVVEWQGAPVTSIKTGWATAIALAKDQAKKAPGAMIAGRPTPHTPRHTCVTWLKQDSLSSFDVAGFVGMSEQMVEEVYGHFDPNFQQGVAKRQAPFRWPIHWPKESAEFLSS